MTVHIAILHAAGTNRDDEAARACRLAGALPTILHVGQVQRGEASLADYDILILPGGFTYGDALGAGSRLALDLELFFQDQLTEFISSGRRVLGICNGFQALVRGGFLPGLGGERRKVTLTHNQCRRFECRWVHLRREHDCKATWLEHIGEAVFCPVAHGEGNFQTADQETLDRLQSEGLVAFRYATEGGEDAQGVYPVNPNGSQADIAGICNPAGNVVGLMPHPEDHVVPLQNPLRGDGRLGLQIFRALVA